MNVLITGATGFIGHRFAEMSSEILEQGDEIILLTSRKIEGYKCILHKDYTFTMEDFISAGITKVDKIVHLGHFLAETHKDDMEVLGNILSIQNTIHLVKHLPNVPDTFVYCSSMAVYGTHREELIEETSGTSPENAYALSKIMTEMFLEEWAEKNGVNLHILRLSHVYGPGDRRRYTIPIWLQAGGNNQPIKLSAYPDMNRNCLYIDDCCRFLAKALYLEADIILINLVSEYNATMQEIAEICKLVSNNPFPIQFLDDGTNIKLQKGLSFNNSLCRQYLGEEKYTLRSGLEREYAYYERNQSIENVK